MNSITIIVLFLLSTTYCAPLVFYVDGKNGNDGNTGSQEKPFATIIKAQDTIRALKGNIPSGGVEVQIRTGDYILNNALQFTSADSGKAGSPITYTAYQKEKVRLLAGQLIPSNSFSPVQPGSNILSTDLKKFGITSYGELASGGLGECRQNQAEVFFNSQPLTIARYPNIAADGIWQFIFISKVIDQTSITYNGTRPSGWTQAKDLWLHGYWSQDWADSYVKVSKVNPSTSTFTIDSATPPVYGFQAKARYYALNLLEELDAPNEYFIDRNNGILYIYSLKPLTASDEIAVSVGQSIISLTDTQYLTFQDLDISFSRQTGISAQNVNNVQIIGSTISNHGQHGIVLSGANSNLTHNIISGCGCSGIKVYGGNQKTLTPGNLLINNNEISYYSRIIRTYNPGVNWNGVGITVNNNFIHDAPHNGILGGGNNCHFEGNRLRNLCYEVSDSGAFYTGRSWIDRGNVLRQNTFENIYNIEPIVLGWPSVQAVYLDDQMSGWSIEGNTFINCQTGVVIGGGRRNNVTNNHFTNCTLSVHFDNRGMNWQNSSCAPGGSFEQQLNSVNYKQPPWSTAYPELVNIMQDHPCVPVYNNILNNYYCEGKNFIDATAGQVKDWFSVANDNVLKC